MSVYFCQGCCQYKDADVEGIELHPISECEVCENCYDSFMEWADYKPEDNGV